MLKNSMSCTFLFHVRSPNSDWSPALKLLPLLLLIVLAGCTTQSAVTPAAKIAPANSAAAPTGHDSAAVRADQVRMDCIQGRRLICGKVLQISPGGLVVDSGYTDLLKAPLVQSWVVPGSVSASRNPAVLELNEPGTPGIGLVFLTDLPKRPKVKTYDYVVMMGYPAGQYVYTPAPHVEKPVRKFSCGLDTAVQLNLQVEHNLNPK
jgi:hypothetical protein